MFEIEKFINHKIQKRQTKEARKMDEDFEYDEEEEEGLEELGLDDEE